MSKRAASYLRVSTAQQAGDSRHGRQRQTGDVSEYAAHNNLEVVASFEDVISGKTVTRQGLERLKREAQDLGVAAVVISGVDRLARDVSASYRLLNELLELGLEVHAADFGMVDMTEDANVIQFGFRGLFAHLEHSGIRRKTLAARVAMAKDGRLPGGISAYGFMSVKGRAFPHPEEAPVVKRVFLLAAEGRSYNEIAEIIRSDGTPSKRNKRWHPGTVSKIISNRIYLGETVWRDFALELPQLIAPELWQKAQRHRVGVPPSLGWPLVGYLRCGRCGNRMSGHRARKPSGVEVHRYRCNAQGGIGKARCGAVLSKAKTEGRVFAAVRAAFEDEAQVRALLDLGNRKDDAEQQAKLALIDAEDAEAFEARRQRIITFAELGMIRDDLNERRRNLLAEQRTETYPIFEYMEAAQTLSVPELMGLINLVAIITKDSLEFEVERA